jgi:hypothetical protein
MIIEARDLELLFGIEPRMAWLWWVAPCVAARAGVQINVAEQQVVVNG